jgi:FtsP/CotA-like multicopper oxidase with cupredoxin domain
MMDHRHHTTEPASSQDDHTPAYAEAYAAAQPDPGHQVVSVEMEACEIDWEFVSGVSSRAWGFNGTIPGPTLEATVGDVFEIHFTNRLPEPTVVHWHGLRIPWTGRRWSSAP